MSESSLRRSRNRWSRPTVTGVSEDDMLHALRFAIHHVRQDDDMVMFIGPDTSGNELVEVGVVIWWGGELAIVHAMGPARDKYRR
jgi:hypothetical protein